MSAAEQQLLEKLRDGLLAIAKLKEENQSLRQAQSEPIAIIGMGCRFPGSDGLESFWHLLASGQDAITPVPPERWDVEAFYDPDPDAPGKMYVRTGGFLQDVEQFDPAFFGIAPREAVSLDPQQRLLLETAWEALEHGGLAPDRLAGSRTGVFIGICGSDYVQRLLARGEADITAYLGTGTASSVAAGRLSYWLGLHGPSLAIDTACSSSLVAVHQAIRSLRSGECRLALAGGVSLMMSPVATINFCKARMLAPDGRCKTFDAAANGYVRGEGCGLIVLKRLGDARQDGDRVLALLRGSAVNQDGRSGGLTVPSRLAQEAVIREALANAGLTGPEIRYVEAHGTGTSLGDPIEVEALAAALGQDRPVDDPLLIGSVKTNLGHLEAAAGIAGLIKVVLALQHESIPRHLHFVSPNPHIPWAELPIRVADQETCWPRESRRRMAGVSSFSFSGTNAHLIVEEAPGETRVPAAADRPWHILTLSARTEPALRDLVRRYLDQVHTESLADIAHTANAGRSHFPHRMALAADSLESARQRLAEYLQDNTSEVVCGQSGHPRIAFLFTGQGSQYVGMGRQLFDSQPTFRQTLLQCEALLRPYLARPLTQVLFEETELLDRTEYTQPALFALEYSLAALWQSWGITPNAVLGHSVGEYAAACVAGVFGLEDGLRLIAERGRRIGALPAGGGMAAVFADAARTQAAIEPWGRRVALSALNGPASTVISGDCQSLAAARAALEQRGIRSVPLAVSHAFHSHLMEPMLADFARTAAAVQAARPRISLVSNLTGRPIDNPPDAAYWTEHIRQPVRFAEGMQSLKQLGCTLFLELGPQPTLIGLGRQILTHDAARWLPSLQRGRGEWPTLLRSLGQLYVDGAAVDWVGFDRDYTRRKVSLPTYPFQRQRYWVAAPEADRLPEVADWLYELEWEQQPVPGAVSPADFLHGPQTLAATLGARSDEVLRRIPAHYGGLAAELELLATDHVVEGMRQLGVSWEPGQRLTVESLGLPAKQRRLAQRLLGLLEADGLLQPAEPGWVIMKPLPDVNPGARLARLLAAHPRDIMEATLLGRCGEQLAAVLRGECNPLGLLFPRTGELSAESFYGQAAGIQTFNVWLADAVAAAAAGLPVGRKLRVLEIGAGTGGATAPLLERLPPERTEYLFTDITAGFLAAARERFAARGGLDFQVLDIERDPLAQGLPAHGFDVILAANVLHATADLRSVLAHVRQLLAPAGLLVLLESTRALRWVDLTFGLLDGWWKFTDHDLRPAHPLLTAAQWQRLLTQTGFAETACLPADDAVGQAVILARAAVVEPARQPSRRLIFADSSGVAAVLASQVESILVEAGGCYARQEPGRFQVEAKRPEDFQRLLEEVGTDGPVEEAVYLWGIDRPSDVSACAGLLHLVQALVRQRLLRPARLTLATRGALAVQAGDELPGIWNAPLWGLAQVIAREHPELTCRRIDLDPTEPPEAAARQLLDELAKPDEEDQLAYRESRRLVPRLTRNRKPAQTRLRLSADAAYLITGGLGNLGLLAAGRLVERGARHLVLIGRNPPRDAARPVLNRLEQAGARVHVRVADVSDKANLALTLAGIAADLPPLRGIIHAASSLDDSLLLKQSWERFERAMAAKLMGAWNLHCLTRDLPLDFFVLYSSTGTLLGMPGHGNYAAANAFLDALAHLRRSQGLPALTINWGLWRQAAQQLGLLEQAADSGLGIIDAPTGLAALERALGQDSPQVAIFPAAWDKVGRQAGRKARWLARLVDRPNGRFTQPRETLRARLAAALPTERQELLVEHVQRQAARVLDLRDGLADRRAGFFDLGMDSLMAVELRNRLQTDLEGPALGSTAVFDHPTPEALARHLADLLKITAPDAAAARSPGRDEPIAIVGLACRFPGGPDPEAYWQLLERGEEAVREIPPDRWDVNAFYDPTPDAPGKMYVRRAGLLDRLDQFDPGFFGIAPREAVGLDPQQRLLLEVAWEALERAGLGPDRLSGSRTGVYIGLSGSDYGSLLARQGADAIDAYLGSGTSPAAAAGRVSFVLGLQGPSVAIDTACSSSLVAVSQACDALRMGRCDLALAGGVHAIVAPEAMIAGCKARMLSPDGRCKTFAAAADGFVRGEGCGLIVLKRLSEAQRDGDRILALIRGSAVNQDGRSGGLTVPNGTAQQAVVREALALAGVLPHQVSYVEAHGTGTSLGDPIEVQALAAVLGPQRQQPLRIGSVKTNIGHLEAAAGIAGLIKVVLALEHEQIPRHLHFVQPNPHIPWNDLPIEVVQEPAPWPRGPSPRLAGVSSFGFSGTNAHVVLEEAPVAAGATSERDRTRHILTLSARNEPALQELASRFRALLARGEQSFADVCHTANTGRSHFEHRLAVVAPTCEEAARKLAADGDKVIRGLAASKTRPRVAFFFPPASSLSGGLVQSLHDGQPAFQGALRHCEELLGSSLPRPLCEYLFMEGGQISRPAWLAFQYALAQMWQSWGIAPSVVLAAGEGEFAAACAAGVFAIEDGLRLAVADDHARQMTFARPRVRLVSSLTGLVLAADETLAASHWLGHSSQLPDPGAVFQSLHAEGCSLLLELGPATLTEPRDGAVQLLPAVKADVDGWETLLHSLARLYAAGVPIDWAAFDRGYSRRRVILPTYPFQRQRYWVEGEAPRKWSNGLLYDVAWRRVEAGNRPKGESRSWLILADSTGLGERLGSCLAAQGHAARVMPAAGVEAASALEHADDVVFMGGLDQADGAAAAEHLTCAVLRLSQQLARQARPTRLHLATRGAVAVRSGEEACPAQAALWGFGKTLAIEHPLLWGGLTDLPAAIAEASPTGLAAALALAEDLKAWRDGTTWVARLQHRGPDQPASPLRFMPEGTYLISGGLGALGLHTARWLVEHGACRLVLLGRQGLASAARTLAVRELEQLGATIQVAAVDVADRSLLERVLRSLDGPPVRGVFHAAGELADGVIANQSAERLARAFAAKVRGAENLDELTRGMPVDHFVLYSSAAALLGSAGQSGYAAANAYLDGLAERRRAQGLPALSVNWGPWAEGGLAAHSRRAAAGVAALAASEALGALETLLQTSPPVCAVLKADWARLGQLSSRSWPFLAELVKAAPRDRPDLRERLAQAAPGRRAALCKDHVRTAVAEVLRLSPDAVADQVGFFDLGMDSLMALELCNRLQAELPATPLTATIVFDHPTVEALAGQLAQKFNLPMATDPSSARLDRLSDDELLRLLDQKASRLLGKDRT